LRSSSTTDCPSVERSVTGRTHGPFSVPSDRSTQTSDAVAPAVTSHATRTPAPTRAAAKRWTNVGVTPQPTPNAPICPHVAESASRGDAELSRTSALSTQQNTGSTLRSPVPFHPGATAPSPFPNQSLHPSWSDVASDLTATH